MFTGIVLAAGLSERFGSPKALALLSNKPAIELIQNTLIASACDEIVVILGAHAASIEPHVFNHMKVRLVYNKHYNFGQTSSVQAGAQAASDNSHLMIFPVDCPLIKTETVDQLISYFNQGHILIPTYNAKRGHPPIFHAELRNKICALEHNVGLNSLFEDYPPQEVEVNDPGIIKTFNTPEEFEQVRK